MTFRALAVLAAGLLIAADLPAQEKDKQSATENERQELDKLQGDWVMVSFESKPEERRPPGDIEEKKLAIKGERWIAIFQDNVSNSTVRIDPSKEPKALDRLIEAGPNRTRKRLCIYKLEGDTLTICSERGSDGVRRPKEFTIDQDGGAVLFVYKRATK